jgi:hypothetical protein
MRTMTFPRINKLLERGNITAVPRRGADRVRTSAHNIDNLGFDFAGQQGDLQMMVDFHQPEADITVLTIPLDNKRPAAATSKSRAENWVETERFLTETLYENGRRRQCMCARAQDRKRVRFISLDWYVVREVDYCQCAASCSALLSEGEGFFLSAPCKPGTVFSLRLLRTLHAQGPLGSVSKPAWSAGLHVVLEEDLKTSLPRFDEEVCIVFEFTFDFRY